MSPGYVATLRVPLLRGREFTGGRHGRGPQSGDGERDAGASLLAARESRRQTYSAGAADAALRSGGRAWGTCTTWEWRWILSPRSTCPSPSCHGRRCTCWSAPPGTRAVSRRELRARVLALDRDQPVTAVETMDEVLETAAAQPRFTASLLGVLSGTALLLALVGIYGVISYSVAERTQEMGIRLALGAERADILRLVLRQGLSLAAVGHRDRAGRVAGVDAIVGKFALSGKHDRSVDVRRRRGAVCFGGAGGQLYSGAAGHTCGPHPGAAV